FLIGCLESISDTSVIRLGYENGVATARSLSAAELSQMSRDPLMRSTDVLRALFHRAAVVTEADSARAFYDEMNGGLYAENRGVQDALFLNAQNRDTIQRIVGPLRRTGIPAVAIVDLDLLEDGSRATWLALLETCGVLQPDVARLDSERRQLAAAFAALP